MSLSDTVEYPLMYAPIRCDMKRELHMIWVSHDEVSLVPIEGASPDSNENVAVVDNDETAAVFLAMK